MRETGVCFFGVLKAGIVQIIVRIMLNPERLSWFVALGESVYV